MLPLANGNLLLRFERQADYDAGITSLTEVHENLFLDD